MNLKDLGPKTPKTQKLETTFFGRRWGRAHSGSPPGGAYLFQNQDVTVAQS